MSETPKAGIKLQIRVSDCDSFGHVNNAIYVSFIEHALAAAVAARWTAGKWDHDNPYRWAPRSMHLEYHQTAVPGDRLFANLWLVKADLRTPVVGCEIVRLDLEAGESAPQTLVRSRSSWVQLSRQNGQVVPIDEGMLIDVSRDGGRLPRAFRPASIPQGLRHYHWDHTVMRAEVGPDGYVHPQAIYQWIEEGIFSASAQAGWPIQRWQEVGFVVFTIRHDTTFEALPKLGDQITIINRVIDVRRLKGTWLNEIRRESDNALLARNYTTGIFLDLEGHPSTPPESMMEAIQFDL